jgi:hypothetical protein
MVFARIRLFSAAQKYQPPPVCASAEKTQKRA